jgi:NitT/TauT family transport system substrate-binding protein
MAIRLVAALAAAGAILAAASAEAQSNVVRVGWCARTVTSAAAPYAAANKFGWFGDFKVQLVPLPSSTDCIKNVATREVPYANASPEPLAVIRLQGVKMKNYYTAYQGNILGLRVPADSPVREIKDLKGKKIGVIALGGAAVLAAKGILAASGLDPDADVTFVAAGESAQTAALVRARQVDALSQFDTQYALVENAGVPLRRIPSADIDRFPSNGFMALEETLTSRRAEAAALARGYAMGTIFAMANPEAAIRILWEAYPQTRATSKDEATALKDDMKTLLARAEAWKLEKGNAKKWGESNMENYDAYLDFLLKNAVIKEKPAAVNLVTNDLIDEINNFDVAAIEAQAKAYKP